MGWVARRHASLHTSLTDLGFKPRERAQYTKPYIHPSGVGKLIAIGVQRMTAVEDCEGKSVRLYDGWRVDYAAGWRKLPHVGFLQSARATLEMA
jgi:hypothetical protein